MTPRSRRSRPVRRRISPPRSPPPPRPRPPGATASRRSSPARDGRATWGNGPRATRTRAPRAPRSSSRHYGTNSAAPTDDASVAQEERDAKYVGALDQGTTSTRFMIFDHGGQVVAIHQKEHEQIYPKPGWVEHDPAEIWARSQEVIRGALDKAGITASDLAAVGITNQRETAVVWTGTPARPSTTRSCGRTRGPTSSSTSSPRRAARTASARRSACRSRRTSRGRRSSGSSTTSTAPVPRPRR